MRPGDGMKDKLLEVPIPRGGAIEMYHPPEEIYGNDNNFLYSKT